MLVIFIPGGFVVQVPPSLVPLCVQISSLVPKKERMYPVFFPVALVKRRPKPDNSLKELPRVYSEIVLIGHCTQQKPFGDMINNVFKTEECVKNSTGIVSPFPRLEKNLFDRNQIFHEAIFSEISQKNEPKRVK